MTSYPLPPPPAAGPSSAPAAKAPAFGWAAVAAGVLGLLAFFLPWFTPKASGGGQSRSADTSFHAWNGYIFLIVAPLILIIAGVLWALTLLGRQTRYSQQPNPLRSLATLTLAAGVIAILVGLIAFPVLHSTYKFKSGSSNISWSAADKLLKAEGASLSSGPQIGLWLLFIGGAIMLVIGGLTFVASGKGGATLLSSGPAHGSGYNGPSGPPSFPPPAAPGQPGSPFSPQGGQSAPGYPPPGSSPAPGYQAPNPPYPPSGSAN